MKEQLHRETHASLRFVKRYRKVIKESASRGNVIAQKIITCVDDKPDGWEFELFFHLGLLAQSIKEAQS